MSINNLTINTTAAVFSKQPIDNNQAISTHDGYLQDDGNEITSDGDRFHVPVCDKFGFIVDENGNNGVSNLRNFKSEFTQEQDSQASEEVIAKLKKREQKWLSMFKDSKTWNKLVAKDYDLVRRRCRKGIPSSVRGTAWFHLSGAHISMQKYPKFYEKLEREPGDEQVCDDIRKDINRQFPNHVLFREENGLGQQSLFNVLKCFAIVRKEVAYCQGLAPLASILIMQMPPAHAFWVLLSISDHYLPSYYLAGFQAIQLHGLMLYKLLKKFTPTAYRIIKKADIDPVLIMFEWFMCLFVRNLPWPSVLRIFDMFLCEGVVVIFKTAIIIIGTTITRDFAKKDQHEILQALRNIPEKDLQENFLIPKVLALNLTDNDLKKEHRRQLRNRNRQK